MTGSGWQRATVSGLGASIAILVSACGVGAPQAASGGRTVQAAQYLAIARPANHRLDVDFDELADHDHTSLRLAAADLRDAALTERQFDRQLVRIVLPPAIAKQARQLVVVNEARARLASQAARSGSLGELRQYQPRLTAANAPVEAAVHVIRHLLGLPPPSTS